MQLPPTKQKQIEAIIGFKTHLLAEQLGLSSQREINWTITRNELVEHILEHCPHGWAWWVNFSPSTYDGGYLIDHDSYWEAYEQERGAKCWKMNFPSKRLTVEAILDRYFILGLGIE